MSSFLFYLKKNKEQIIYGIGFYWLSDLYALPTSSNSMQVQRL